MHILSRLHGMAPFLMMDAVFTQGRLQGVRVEIYRRHTGSSMKNRLALAKGRYDNISLFDLDGVMPSVVPDPFWAVIVI